jgi:hypothetical protein
MTQLSTVCVVKKSGGYSTYKHEISSGLLRTSLGSHAHRPPSLLGIVALLNVFNQPSVRWVPPQSLLCMLA